MSEEEINYWLETFEETKHAFMSKDGKILSFHDTFKTMKDLQQEITKLKGVIETYEIIIKSTNVLNWHELKKWLEEESKLKGSETAYLYYGRVSNKMQELENKQCHTTLE